MGAQMGGMEYERHVNPFLKEFVLPCAQDE